MDLLTIGYDAKKLALSKLILGTGQYGTGIPEGPAMALLDQYAALGGNTLDTAAVYGRWGEAGEPVSEQIIGRWMKTRNCRERTVLITKGAHFDLKTPEVPRVSAQCIDEDIAQSMEALQTGYVDVYLLHRDDPKKEVAEIMECLDRHVKAGRIGFIGVSNWTVDRILEANRYAEAHGLSRFCVSELQWSLAHVTRENNEIDNLPHMTPEDEQRYLEINMPVLAWNSQASGVFTKALRNGPDSLNEGQRKKYWNAETQRRAEKVQAACAARGVSPTQVVLEYITRNPLPAAAIIGCSNLEQLRDSIEIR